MIYLYNKYNIQTFLFDVEMFTHLNLTTAQSYTTGEIVNGSNSGATGVVQSISATTTAT